MQGGPGINNIQNNTGIPVILQGVTSGTTQVTGQVIINDSLTGVGTTYLYQPGEPVQVSTHVLNSYNYVDSQIPLGTAISYAPQTGARYQWTNTATITRTLTNSTSTGQWTFASG